MILSCPVCESQFLVPATVFEAGPRDLRCAQCGHHWRAEMPQESAPAFTPAAAMPPVAEMPAAPMQTPLTGNTVSRPFWRQPFWLGAIILAGIFMIYFILARDVLTRNYPWMSGIYDNTGLHVYRPGEGLVLAQVHSELQFENGLLQLVVEGKIRNESGQTQNIPNLLATAIGSDGKPMQSWQIDAPTAKVATGAEQPFHSEIRAPQGTVTEINLSFINPDHAP